MKPQKQLQNKGVYFKMTLENKKALKTLVFQKGFTIKLVLYYDNLFKAAQKLSINYSSAKTAVLQFRQQQMRKCIIYLYTKPCLVKNASKINNNLKIISQTGGVIVDEKVYCLS